MPSLFVDKLNRRKRDCDENDAGRIAQVHQEGRPDRKDIELTLDRDLPLARG